MSLPYCTPDGHAVSHARQSRHNSKCPRTPIVQLELPVRYTSHQINAAARTFIFIARFDVRGHADVHNPQCTQSSKSS